MYGSKENLAGVEFIKGLRKIADKQDKKVLLIAEESSIWDMVTGDIKREGLGFDYKWDLGWMNDTLAFMKKPPVQRRENLHKLTFSMMYYSREYYLLPLSHDENVHGKATILQKMWGDYETKFPQGRLLYTYMMVHPGKKLDFMGNEFGQLREWDESRQQDWELLQYPIHDSFMAFRTALQKIYLK